MANKFYAANTASPEKTVSYTYDVYGRMTSYSDGTTSGAFTYDETNRARTVTVDYGLFTKSYTYRYDTYQRPSAFICGATSNSFMYGADGRLTGISIPGEGAISLNGNRGWFDG